MATEKIERLLGALSGEELHRLEKFLRSEYFEVTPRVRDFGLHYLEARRRPGWALLTVPQRWSEISAKRFDDGKWRKHKSEFAAEVERFMVTDARLRAETALSRAVLLLGDLDRRRLDQDFESEWKRSQDAARLEKAASWGDLLEVVRYWEAGYNYFVDRQDPNRADEREEESFRERMQALERFVTFDYLKMATAIENGQRMRRSALRLAFPQYFAAMLQQQRDAPNSLFQAYIHLFDVLQEERRADLPTFLAIVSPAIQEAAIDEAALLFDYAVNLFVRRYLARPTMENSESILELYRLGLERDILRWPSGWISIQHYKNILTIGIRCGEIQFVQDFVASNRSRIGSDDASLNLLAFCDALLEFGLGNYRLCVQILNGIDRDRYLKVEIRTLEIKAFFELKEFDIVESKLANFERFLNRSGYPPSRRRALTNRIRVMRKLLFVTDDRPKLAKLMESIQSSEVVDTEWLLDFLRRIQNNPAPK